MHNKLVRPCFTVLNAQNAMEYAEHLAAIFGTKVAGDVVFSNADGFNMYSVKLADGTTADIWLECGFVYGEA